MSKGNGHKLKSYKTKTIICVAVIVILVIAVTYLTVYGIFFIKDDQENISVTYGITFFSFAISVFALLIALKTYSSIDSVNAITSMDGNVLENEHYAVSYYEMAKSFLGDKEDSKEKNEEDRKEKRENKNDEEETEEEKYIRKVFDNMQYAKKKTTTCVEYADWLQNIIDNVIWLRYMDYESEKYEEKRKSLIIGIARELEKYSALSNGIQYTLQEHVKLIENVFDYTEWSGQNKKNQEKPNLQICKLEEVRGSMIRNPVSKLVYYDYLGRYYHKMTKTIIMKIIGDKDLELIEKKEKHTGKKEKLEEKKESLAERRVSSKRERNAQYYLTIWEKFSRKAGGSQKAGNRETEGFDSERKKISIFLDRALSSLEKASKLAEGDLLWQAYTGYDYVRVKMLKLVIDDSQEADNTEIGRRLNQVLSDRRAVQCLYSKEDTYLYKKFGREIERARELKEAFEKFIGIKK